MIYGSTSTNINFLTLLTAVCSIAGVFYFEFNWTNVLVCAIAFYVLNILGNWMMLHRYYSHKSFEFKHSFLKTIFTALAILAGRGSPLSWSYIHRQHHAFSDTEKDPHSPVLLGFKLFGFGHYKQMEIDQFKLFSVKDLLTQEQLIIHKYYMLFIAAFVIALGLLGIELLYFAWCLPVFLVHLSQNTFNYFGHTSGYRNFETNDNSRNNAWLFPLILGEAWHNNHHRHSRSCTTKINKSEWDPLSFVIDLVKK